MQKIALVLSGFALGVAGTAGAVLKGSAVFSDVPSGAYFDEAVGEMYNAGIIKGYEGTNKFGPNDSVTRGQVAVMMQRLRNDILGVEASGSSRSSRSSSTSTSSTSSSSSAASANPKGSLRFTTEAFSVDEKASDVTVTVIRAEGKDDEVTVDYEVTAGTATADSDFEILSGTLRFADGESTKTFNVGILDDSTSESAETINIKLLNPKNGASLGTPSTAVLTIKANDGGSTSSSSTSNAKGTLNFSATEYQVAENGGSITVTVERTGGSTSSVGVSYATSNGTADSEHYNSTNGTLSFTDGETSKTFTITVLNNDVVGGNKTVNLTLSDATGGASLGTYKTSKVVIADDEVATTGSGSFKLDDDDYVVGESEGQLSMIIKRTGGASGELKVNYATQSGTAKAGTDFADTTGTLTFRAGESQKTVVIPILADDNDPSEAFSFHITSNNGSLISSPSSASIQIDQ